MKKHSEMFVGGVKQLQELLSHQDKKDHLNLFLNTRKLIQNTVLNQAQTIFREQEESRLVSEKDSFNNDAHESQKHPQKNIVQLQLEQKQYQQNILKQKNRKKSVKQFLQEVLEKEKQNNDYEQQIIEKILNKKPELLNTTARYLNMKKLNSLSQASSPDKIIKFKALKQTKDDANTLEALQYQEQLLKFYEKLKNAENEKQNSLENLYQRKSNRERQFLQLLDEMQKKDMVIQEKLDLLSSRLKVQEKKEQIQISRSINNKIQSDLNSIEKQIQQTNEIIEEKIQFPLKRQNAIRNLLKLPNINKKNNAKQVQFLEVIDQ